MHSRIPSIEELIPHRGSMLWLERVTQARPESIEAEAVVRRDAWYVDEQAGMPAWLGIELMAQAIAAHVGMQGWLAGKPPKPGVLLGCRRYEARVGRFAPGILTVVARVAYRDESGFGAYDCAILGAQGELAAGRLKVYEPEDFERFLSEASAAA